VGARRSGGDAGGAEQGWEVELPTVPGVPAGLMQQLALLPVSRPPCGTCAACAPDAADGGSLEGRRCLALAALRRWDALLPALTLPELRQLARTPQPCARCRACLLAAHGGAGARPNRRSARPPGCLALSLVRGGPDRAERQLDQLAGERARWEAAAGQQAGGAVGTVPAAAPVHQPSASSTSDSEGSNRSRLWLRSQRRRKASLYLQPLPAPDGRLPLPAVPGVRWSRVEQMAHEWVDGPAPRCGLCSGCLEQQPQQQQAGDGGSGAGGPARCAAAAALTAWHRQLGPVTVAAVSALAKLPAAQLRSARCGMCQQCRRAPAASTRPQRCATGESLLLPLQAEPPLRRCLASPPAHATCLQSHIVPPCTKS
jgi:hypothetical protein